MTERGSHHQSQSELSMVDQLVFTYSIVEILLKTAALEARRAVVWSLSGQNKSKLPKTLFSDQLYMDVFVFILN